MLSDVFRYLKRVDELHGCGDASHVVLWRSMRDKEGGEE
jgi:hypothetical protein